MMPNQQPHGALGSQRVRGQQPWNNDVTSSGHVLHTHKGGPGCLVIASCATSTVIPTPTQTLGQARTCTPAALQPHPWVGGRPRTLCDGRSCSCTRRLPRHLLLWRRKIGRRVRGQWPPHPWVQVQCTRGTYPPMGGQWAHTWPMNGPGLLGVNIQICLRPQKTARACAQVFRWHSHVEGARETAPPRRTKSPVQEMSCTLIREGSVGGFPRKMSTPTPTPTRTLGPARTCTPAALHRHPWVGGRPRTLCDGRSCSCTRRLPRHRGAASHCRTATCCRAASCA